MRALGRTACLLSLATALPLAQAGPADRSRQVEQGEPVTRHFAWAGELQIHYRQAGHPDPAAGVRPVVCLHQSPNSSQVFVEFLSELGRDRLSLAPDTPGYGESDVPGQQPSIADYARTMEQWAESLNLGPVDIVGYHTGAAIGVEWSLRHPGRVHSLTLVGVPAFTEEEQEQFSRKPWPNPAPLSEDQLSREWRGSKSWQGPGQSDDSIERTFLAKINAGQTAWWGPAAVFDYPMLERLALTTAPVLIIRAGDDLWEATERASAARPDATVIDLPEFKFAVFEIAPQKLAAVVRQHVNGASAQ